MFYRALALAVAVAVVPCLVVAQDSTSRACRDTADTQFSLTRCAGSDFRRSRTRLQRLLQELRATLDSEALPTLDSVQRRWDVYSRAQCRWEGEAYEGGSMRSMIESDCLAHQTEARIAELKLFLCGWDNQTGKCDAAKKYDVPPENRRE